ncbi:hypothetical protein MNBD_GAMMA11-1135 [hydrothermal vent metagenome]|uniref:Uncharacterized protein n=1 Tax=hydrothermal vent metagenome TaxID=652676 RepID=A0A3B0XIX8_9ZZZZ
MRAIDSNELDAEEIIRLSLQAAAKK